MLGAVLLGVASVMVPKVRPDDHWSDSPKIVIVIETEAESSGEPGGEVLIASAEAASTARTDPA